MTENPPRKHDEKLEKLKHSTGKKDREAVNLPQENSIGKHQNYRVPASLSWPAELTPGQRRCHGMRRTQDWPLNASRETKQNKLAQPDAGKEKPSAQENQMVAGEENQAQGSRAGSWAADQISSRNNWQPK
jgi:hypothetical protein